MWSWLNDRQALIATPVRKFRVIKIMKKILDMKQISGLQRKSRQALSSLITVASLTASLSTVSLLPLLWSQNAAAGAREKARQIHDRLAGVPPTDTVLASMELLIDGGDMLAAADIAMDNPAFYSVTLNNVAAPWTNRDQDIFVPLNDYIATYIGLVRDQADFREILSADVIYVGTNAPAYSNSSNAHYESLENLNLDLGSSAVLQRSTQSAETGIPSSAAAGILTTRAAARAFFIDGTNRAMFRYTLLNHMCYDMEQLKDTTRPADRIRQDVSRTPGGDSRLFMNGCVGCHSGMDPFSQAFAYYQFSYPVNNPDGGAMTYNQGAVEAKYFNNANTFPYGFVTPNDNWSNFWRDGINKKLLGWDNSLSGFGAGASSMGEELAHSEAFARCHVVHAFETTCLRKPADQNDLDEIDRIQLVFSGANYNLKRVFAETASYCAGN